MMQSAFVDPFAMSTTIKRCLAIQRLERLGYSQTLVKAVALPREDVRPTGN
jgi:hypothetical protein